jgi:hypothetical protein
MSAVEFNLAFGRPTGADDSDLVVHTLSPNDEYEALADGTDGDEAVLKTGVLLVE